jgi:hypothetical protein
MAVLLLGLVSEPAPLALPNVASSGRILLGVV